ncbi:unnamed protein product [Adineta ricciae]|uniref:Condensin complex subunit 2 n=1 Tax=Adineta ricciae TaxID=249248 RepID=A0A814M5Z5_ADIRI|nr:unnamed protein product [Adineta ricciae]
MLSLSSSQNEPSALLSNARVTIATLIQRPSTVTTSNAFEEFSILDHLIDVSNDVERCEDGESRKFLNIAQLITASTCIYSRRVDALYKLINTFQSSTSEHQSEENHSDNDEQLESVPVLEQEKSSPQKSLQEKKRKSKEDKRSFICTDLNRINFNPSKPFFLDRTALFDLKLFQKYVPIGNKQFWINDNQPMIFNLLFDHELHEVKNEPQDNYRTQHESQQSERLADALNNIPAFDVNDIPLPISDDNDNHNPSWNNEETFTDQLIAKKKVNRNRTKKVKDDIDLNIFRQGLSHEQQALFRCHKMKSITNKVKVEREDFFAKKFNRLHFHGLIKDIPSPIISIIIYPTITVQHLTIRERYLTKIDQTSYRTVRSPPIPITDVLDDNAQVPLSPLGSFSHEMNDDDEGIQEDFDIRLQTDMEQFLDAAICQSNEEQEHNKIFLELRSNITLYMNQHNVNKTIDAYDLIETLDEKYSLPLIFGQLLHLCGSTQRYHLHSNTNDTLFLETIAVDKRK